MLRIAVLMTSAVVIFNWFSRENCALAMGFLTFHQFLAYFICILTGGADDILKLSACACMLPLIIIICKYFSMDPVDDGIIINEQ